jgi:hypothetical protein
MKERKARMKIIEEIELSMSVLEEMQEDVESVSDLCTLGGKIKIQIGEIEKGMKRIKKILKKNSNQTG